MVSGPLHFDTNAPKTQNEDASETKQSTSLPQDFPPGSISEGTGPVKDLLDGCDKEAVLLTRKRVAVAAVWEAERDSLDSTELPLSKRRCEMTSDYVIDGSFDGQLATL